jgi:hypothetical protein
MAWGMAAAGLLGYLGAREAAKSNVEAGQEASRREADRLRQVSASGNVTGGPLGSQSFDPERGFTQDFGSSGAAAARGLGTRQATDEASATRVKDALGNFKLNIPTLADARGIVEGKRNDQNRIIRDTLGERQLENRRLLRDTNTGADANLIAQIGRLNTNLPDQEYAVKLFQQAQGADLGNLQKTIAAYQPQGLTAENYPQPSLGGTSTLAQIPITQPTPDISGALVPAGAGNVLQQVLNAREVERLEGRSDEARRELLASIRQNPNQFNVPLDVGGAGGDFNIGLPKLIT